MPDVSRDDRAGTDSAPRHRARTFAAAFSTAFLALGVWEGLALAPDARLEVVASTTGFAGLVGWVIGVASLLLLPAHLRAWEAAGAAVLAPHRATQTAPADLIRAAARLIAAAVAASPLALMTAVAGRVAHGFVQGGFAGPFTALGALAGGVCGWFVFAPARDLAEAGLSRLSPSGRIGPLPLPFALVAVAGLSGLGVLALMLQRMDLGAWRLGWTLGVAAAIGGAILLAQLRPSRRLLAGRAGWIPIALALALSVQAVAGFEASETSRRVVPRDGGLSRVTLLVLRSLLDRDGDGASAALAGGDCDDTQAEVGPHASEIPGNGIDDNCEGGDAPAEDETAAEPSDAETKGASAADTPGPERPSDGATVPPNAAGTAGAPRWNIVLILIDTLRPDHLGLYGYERPTSPNLDAFGKSALVFDHVIAAAPNTPRSMPSIFTGRYPSRIAWVKRYANYGALKPQNETLFELLSGAGYHTEVQSAHWYWDKVPEIKKGVEKWDNRGALSIADSNTQSAAPVLTPRVVERLQALGSSGKAEPFFLFAHYFDPHGRYMNHPEVKQFGTSLLDKYDSEIAYVDHHLGPVLAALEASPLRENTLVIISSDHGESFKEHGFNFHGRTVYQDEVAVPLIVRVPGGKSGRQSVQASLVDLMATMAAVSGAACKGCLGVDLLPIAAGTQAAPNRVVFAEALPYPNYDVHMVAGIDGGRTKLVRNLTENVIELFDLGTDTPERKNVLGTELPAEKPLRDALSKFIEGDRGG